MEEKELIERAKSGDKEAKEQLVKKYNRMVYKLANRYSVYLSQYHQQDLISEGICGLLEAVKKFDHNRGKFATIAYFYIKLYMITYLSSNLHIVKYSKRDKRSKMVKIYKELKDSLGREPEEEEILEHWRKSGINIKDRRVLRSLNDTFFSIDSFDENENILPSYRFEEEVEDEMAADKVVEVSHKILTDRELYVIVSRLKHEKSLVDLGKELKLSKERVRQIESKIIEKLRRYFG